MRCTALLFLALPLAAQHADKSEPKKSHPAIGDSRAIAAGKARFATSCAACHGPAGEGGRGPNLHERGAWHPLDEEALFQTIRNGIPGADMPPTRLPDNQLWEIAAFVRSLTAPAIETTPAGDIAAGEAVFWGKGECGACHRILGRGGLLGPDLSNIGAQRSVDKIREAIVDPDADGFRGYRGAKAVLKDGRVITGVARNYTNYAVQIVDEQGKIHLLETADLRELQLSRRSPMPGDYKQRLSPRELTDVIAYLSRQSARPLPPAAKEP
ncbi:MAG: c-type cytochrome [Bryobacteraceae bacterium]|nr:c-type cytochrome [Bryobacteraceae bacterium]